MSVNRKAPFYLEVGRSRIEEHKAIFKFGRSSTITSTESVIWDGGGDYTFLSSPETLSVVSTDAGDNATGLGARTMVILGLDENYNEITEIVTLTGLTPVITQKSFLRVYRAIVITAGTNSAVTGANIGDITITSSDTAALQAKILSHNGQTLMCVYTIPAGYTGYTSFVSFATGEGKQVLFKTKSRNGPGNEYSFSVKYAIDIFEGNFIGETTSPLVIPEKSDMVITGETSSGTIDTTASFEVLLIKNL